MTISTRACRHAPADRHARLLPALHHRCRRRSACSSSRTSADDPAALALLDVPTLLIIVAYRAYTRAREQQENLQLLHEVTSLLHGGDVDAALGDFLSSARTAFRAEHGRARAGQQRRHRWHDGQPQPGGRRAARHVPGRRRRRAAAAAAPGDRRTARSRPAPAPAAAVRWTATPPSAASRTPWSPRCAPRTGVHGLLLVAGRLGDVHHLQPQRPAPCSRPSARHVATSLERGRLEDDAAPGHRPQGAAAPPDAARRADRAAQPHAVPRPRAPGGRRRGPHERLAAVLYLDLDGFKPVNDEYGHDVGDTVLRTIAVRLRGCLRPADTAARLGGDEFAVLLGGPLDPPGIEPRRRPHPRAVRRPRRPRRRPCRPDRRQHRHRRRQLDTEDADKLIRQCRHRHVLRQAQRRRLLLLRGGHGRPHLRPRARRSPS